MDKAAITPALVERLIAEQFPQWAELPVRPVELDGWDNTTFRLGDELSVRLPSADGYVPQVEKEQRWLPVLAPQLPLAIPQPVARGAPSSRFPRPWSVRRWLPGELATTDRIDGLNRFAVDLAHFLSSLYALDAAHGPPAGAHSWFRGSPLATYDDDARGAIAALEGEIDTAATTAVWERAISSRWERAPVWVHGDVTPSNLLVTGGKLSAVLDFGCSAVGDPACDLAIAWTSFHGESRDTFLERLGLDDETQWRGRGWALWKALITLRDGKDGAVERRFGWHLDARGVIEQTLS